MKISSLEDLKLIFSETITSSDGTKTYRSGLERSFPHKPKSHLYEIGEHVMDFGRPLCRHGWNRGDDYSIWRGNVGYEGNCLTCLKRALAGKSGVEPRNTKGME